MAVGGYPEADWGPARSLRAPWCLPMATGTAAAAIAAADLDADLLLDIHGGPASERPEKKGQLRQR